MKNMGVSNSLSPNRKSRRMPGLFSERVGLHHFAHLRAVSEGIEVAKSAARYLGIEHGHQAEPAHRLAVEQVMALARRLRDRRWRLVALDLHKLPNPQPAIPTLWEWAEAEGLDDGWRESELLAMYQDHFAGALQFDDEAKRKQARADRLRRMRRQLLVELEAKAAEPADPEDPLAAWFSQDLARRLHASGASTLRQLHERIALGGRWWRGVPGVGPTKAMRIARHVELLLSAPARPEEAIATAGGEQALILAPSTTTALVVKLWPVDQAKSALQDVGSRRGKNRVPATESAALEASTDLAAVHAWISARAGSEATARSYEREMERFRYWLAVERNRGLSEATAEDCRRYMDFIAAIPPSWMSRRQVGRQTPGWAPFRGPLTLASQRQAVTILASAHAWLVDAGYLVRNPWTLVNTKFGDDPLRIGLDPTSRAITPEAWRALLDQVEEDALRVTERNRLGAPRARWLLKFCEATGLRAAELLSLRRKHLQQSPEGFILTVMGKGRKARQIPIPSGILKITERYFEARGLDLQTCPEDTPLLGAADGKSGAVSYSALHQSLKGLFSRAARRLSPESGSRLARASAHWLRHTHATRAAERNVPPDVLQEQLGQADPRTTAGYYRAQIKRRAAAMESAFGASE
jgi:integrase